MANIVSNLTKSVIKNYPDFILRPELDYNDGGSRVYGYAYKDILTIDTCRSQDLTYLDIRVFDLYNANDYSFTVKDLRESGIIQLSHKFSKVSEFDMDDLIATCEQILQMVDDLDKKVTSETLDFTELTNRMEYEINIIRELQKSIKTLPFWNIPNEEIKDFHFKITSLAKTKQKLGHAFTSLLPSWGRSDFTTREKREMLQSFREKGYVEISLSDRRVGGVLSAIEKANKVCNNYGWID